MFGTGDGMGVAVNSSGALGSVLGERNAPNLSIDTLIKRHPTGSSLMRVLCVYGTTKGQLPGTLSRSHYITSFKGKNLNVLINRCMKNI